MKRIFCLIFTLIFCTLYAQPPSCAAGTDTVLRVGLAYGSSAKGSVTLSSADGFALGTVSGTDFEAVRTVADEELTVTSDGAAFTVQGSTGSTVYTASGDTLAVRPQRGTTQYGSYAYYGDFVCKASASGALTVLNYARLEDYVKGVLPQEMSASWNLEALKAQAVCARSFALGNLNKHKTYGFDVCSTTNCQVYRGTNRATDNSDAAVEQTAGQVLYADGKLAVGYYYASDGGASESNENVWGGDPISYLRGVVDPYEDTVSIPNGTWSVTLSASQVANKLNAAGYSIGTVSRVEVTKRTDAGNVNQVTVTDTSGKTVVLKNSAVRTVFGLNSIRYTISGGGSSGGNTTTGGGLYINGTQRTDGGLYAVGADGKAVLIGSVNGKTALTGSGKQAVAVTSSTETVTVPTTTASADSFTFTGTGWGHNVGMSQYGALAMAKKGFSYDAILKFYFTGITIEQYAN